MKTLLSLLLNLVLLTAPVYATPVSLTTPEVAAEQAIAEMQKSKDLVVVLDYVHWETAYKTMSPTEKADLKVSSAAELRALYTNLIKDPASYLRNNLQTAKTSASPVVEAMAQGFAYSVEQAKQRIINADYKVSPISTTKHTAYVEILATSNLGTYQKKVQLIQIKDKWYAPSPRSFDSNGYLQSALSGQLLQKLSLPF